MVTDFKMLWQACNNFVDTLLQCYNKAVATMWYKVVPRLLHRYITSRAETDGINLLSGYPDASICGYPTDSDIIMLVLLAIHFIFISTSSAKYSSLSILIST